MKENTTYLVMEIHSAYAVLLDNEGRFVKAANMGYESGDVVRNPVLLKYPQDHRKRLHRMIRISAGIAACICFAIFGIYEYQYMFTPYGSVQMQINPEVRIILSHSGRVLDLVGTNEDGRVLVDGYDYKGKDRYTVTDELTDRAVKMGFLNDGGQVALHADSKNISWAQALETELADKLTEHIKDYDITISVSVGILNSEELLKILDEPQSVTITLPEQTPVENTESDQTVENNSGYGDSAYSDETPAGPAPSDSGGYNSNVGEDHSDSGYGETGEGNSGYDVGGNSGYDNDDGNSGYDNDDGNSGYGDDGNSSYGDNDD